MGVPRKAWTFRNLWAAREGAEPPAINAGQLEPVRIFRCVLIENDSPPAMTQISIGPSMCAMHSSGPVPKPRAICSMLATD